MFQFQRKKSQDPPCGHQTITLERDLSRAYSLLHHVTSKATHVQHLHRLCVCVHTHTHTHSHTHTRTHSHTNKTNLPSTSPHLLKKSGVAVTVVILTPVPVTHGGAVNQTVQFKTINAALLLGSSGYIVVSYMVLRVAHSLLTWGQSSAAKI